MERRRGRPKGSNRTPLSLEERRARNAQYERERRYQNNQAISELTDALGEEYKSVIQTSKRELLAAAVNCISKVNTDIRTAEKELTVLRERKRVLLDRVETLKQELDVVSKSISSNPSNSSGVLLTPTYDSDDKENKHFIKGNGSKDTFQSSMTTAVAPAPPSPPLSEQEIKTEPELEFEISMPLDDVMSDDDAFLMEIWPDRMVFI